MKETIIPTISELGPAIGQLETDTFCEGCGYNLHTQRVVRDERLGILVSRCPECGRFTAAGRTTSASSVWLKRLGTVLLALWVMFLLALFSLSTFFLGMIAYGHARELTTLESNTASGILSRNIVLTNGTSRTQRSWEYFLVPRQIRPDDVYGLHREFQDQLILASIAGAMGLITGGLFSILLWHTRRLRRAFALLPPFLGCTGAVLFWIGDPMTVLIREWGTVQIGLYLLIEIPAVAIGAWIGRPFARGMLNLLVPPKARQHLAFLWIVDGKRLPIRTKTTPKNRSTGTTEVP